MKNFADLFRDIDMTNSTTRKVEVMAEYFQRTSPEDSAWALFFLTGRKLLRLIPAKILREAAQETSEISPWLFEECYAAVGDLAETIALLCPVTESSHESVSLKSWVEEKLIPIKDQSPEKQKTTLVESWRLLSSWECFVFNKLVTGAFRAGVSQSLVIKAISRISDLTEAVIAHRLMGKWNPTAEFFLGLIAPSEPSRDPGVPYPFYLASALEDEVTSLGSLTDWQIEWKWDGIRAQAIKRPGGVYLWSRGEELITERFPEITEAIGRLPAGTVVDGEILPFPEGKLARFAMLQTRIGRRTLTAKLRAEVPAVLRIYDLLEIDGKDLRESPLAERRKRLESLLQKHPEPALQLSETIQAKTWDEVAMLRADSRARNVEGLMLKKLDSPYRVGRKRGDWWKWKIDPLTMDVVLIYAQPGHGRRATLYTDYTFAVWKDKELVPIAKAYSGLTDAEILEMDRWIRKNTLEKFGPVRRVNAELVFELAFEAVAISKRHKAGVAVRFPRILRRRTDKKPADADTVERLQGLIHAA